MSLPGFGILTGFGVLHPLKVGGVGEIAVVALPPIRRALLAANENRVFFNLLQTDIAISHGGSP